VGFKIDLLQTWFQQRQQPSGSNRSSEAKPIGERIGGYEIKESIGHSGGFGEVYKARVLKDGEDREGQVALKILNGGSISALQREVDALSDVHHPYIVELLNHGQTATGDLYIAMEFLQGNTLRDYCQKATRLPEKEVCEIGRKLLDALTALHPDKEKADKLKQKGELTEKELRDREKARHGYIHRDIKPENVVYVPGRGPVLIDFGISSRVLDRIDTQKSTPGYLPPDVMNNPKWTEDVDLYQLGLTLLQVATGVRYRTENGGRNLDDLHILADEELDEPLRSALLTMTADSEAERFDTAREAYRALSRS
jgi:serine/threonine-protein kinase